MDAQQGGSKKRPEAEAEVCVSVLETCKDFDCRYCGDLKFLFYNICHTEKF